jgi:hypothetical protein
MRNLFELVLNTNELEQKLKEIPTNCFFEVFEKKEKKMIL